MSPTLIGALIGAVLGLVNFGVLRAVAARMDAAKPATVQSASQGRRIITLVAWADLLIFPLVGAFAGSRF